MMDLDKFLEIELKYNLLKENLNGFFFWIYARANIQWHIRDNIYSYTPYHPKVKQNFRTQMKLRFKMIVNALKHSHISQKKCDLLVVNSSRKVWVEDHYECIYTDALIEKFPDAIVLEEPYEQMHFTPSKTKNLVYLDMIEIKAQLYYYYNKYINKRILCICREVITRTLTQPLLELSEYYESRIDINAIVEMIIPEYFKYIVKKKYFESIVKRLKPAIILEVASYNPNCMVLNETAKEFNIKVVELQHGVTGSNHIAYNYPEGTKISQFPDYIFTFSGFWNQNIKYPIPENNIISTGFPYLETQSKKYTHDKNGSSKKIVFLSQGIIGKYLAQIAIETANKLDKKKFRIVYKLHPDEYASWKEWFPEIQDTQIEIIDNNRISLYELLAQADIQVGYTSTSIYEGLIYDLDTYVYTRDNNPEMDQLIYEGFAKKFTTSNELVELIIDNKDNNFKTKGEFWKKDALNNILRQLEKLK